MRIISECNQSGIKKSQWCAEHEVDIKAFYRWQRKLRTETYEIAVQKMPSIDAGNVPMIAELKKPVPATSAAPVTVHLEIQGGSILRIHWLSKTGTVALPRRIGWL
jgi:hypothetical protein